LKKINMVFAIINILFAITLVSSCAKQPVIIVPEKDTCQIEWPAMVKDLRACEADLTECQNHI